MIRTSAEAVAQIGEVGALSDALLVTAASSAAVLRRHADAAAAAIAGEIARRSNHELGYEGLVTTAGFADATAMVSSLTSTSLPFRNQSLLIELNVSKPRLGK